MGTVYITAEQSKAKGGQCVQVAAYEFTTLTCIPGVVHYRGAKIQMLDLPGIIEGAKDGKGRGRQVRSTVMLEERKKSKILRCSTSRLEPRSS